ncbi:MAG: ABC transporter ATP-binding protein [Gammaproteobacteria bacterium]|nr:ABC transporter ATP-binding protein [Gammaproteobacteria bacterium]MDP2142267.1 ABC transporter ATP-binding protein [Gammaproteobacteria bacterium]MDP2347589.1 ABC transporter ATP-binding protein [Gammaproteobacteria bacterium]
MTIANTATRRPVVLRASKLCKVYEMGEVSVHALKDVDLDLYEGELLVLLGASGSGKSTLLNILGGLDVASSGSLFFQQQGREQELSRASQTELTNYRREHVGFVFQFYNLIPSLTARENVALVTDIARSPMSPEEALELVGLGPRMHHFPAQLSGGEQQRVAIARAVAKRPHILLCDEPTGALDASTGRLVLSVLDRVNRETGTTTAIITHNAAIGEIGDTVVRMSSGEIVERHHNTQRANVEDVQW